MLQSQEEDIQCLQLEERYISMEVGTPRHSTTTQSSLILTPKNGMILIYTMRSQDGTIVPLWLKLSHHGNISFLEVKLENSQKEVQDISDTVLTVHATLISKQCIGLLWLWKMEMHTTNPLCPHKENMPLWLMIKSNPVF